MPLQKDLFPQFKKIIAVASGKGGVGKSTVSMICAILFKNAGKRVGILDLDLYGPSLPQLLKGDTAIEGTTNKRLKPAHIQGFHTMSMGYLVEKDKPLIWRGPMLHKALHQLIFEVEWPELDVLIVDTPPGTGDVLISLCQKLPLDHVITVTTPHSLAWNDAIKGIHLFQTMNVPVMGVIENMAFYRCGQCKSEERLFKKSSVEKKMIEKNITVLSRLPLDENIAEMSETGLWDCDYFSNNADYQELFKKISHC
jgi:ATP-binding protein involved in chromosome partitioning